MEDCEILLLGWFIVLRLWVMPLRWEEIGFWILVDFDYVKECLLLLFSEFAYAYLNGLVFVNVLVNNGRGTQTCILLCFLLSVIEKFVWNGHFESTSAFEAREWWMVDAALCSFTLWYPRLFGCRGAHPYDLELKSLNFC